MAGCSSQAEKFEKIITKQAREFGVSGGMPVREKGEGEGLSFRIFNMPIYRITEFKSVKVIKYGSVPLVSKEDIKSNNVPSEGILTGLSERCVFSILYESLGPSNNLGSKDITAILADVSIAKIKESPMNNGIMKVNFEINEEYLNVTTPVWFLGYTVTPEDEDREEYYTVKVVCFEELFLFDSLIVIDDEQDSPLTKFLNS